MGATLHNVADFLKKIKRSDPSYQRSSGYASNNNNNNASSEHAFSTLRRVKSYLHTTMSNNCLNHLMTCTVHKELVKELNLKQVSNDFADRVERHSSIFGHFST